jgi:hypothetical protein
MFYRMRKTHLLGNPAGYGYDWYKPTGQGSNTYEGAAAIVVHDLTTGWRKLGLWDATFMKKYPQYFDECKGLLDEYYGMLEDLRALEFQFILDNLYDEYGFHVMACASDGEIHRLPSL